MAKRKVLEILQYDYSTLEELNKHEAEMRERGYHRITGINNMFNLPHLEEIRATCKEDKWKFTTLYMKDMLV